VTLGSRGQFAILVTRFDRNGGGVAASTPAGPLPPPAAVPRVCARVPPACCPVGRHGQNT